MFSTVRRHTLFIITFLLAGIWVSAGNNPEYRQTLFGKYGSLLPNNTVFTSDLNFAAYKNTPGAIEKTYYVKNAVRFMIDEESEWHALSDFTATLYLEVNTENAAGTLNMVKKTLVLDFKKGQGMTSGAITSYEFKDAVNVNVKIDSLKTNVTWDATNNLKLVNEIISLRDWGFNCGTAITNIVTDSLFADEWKVKWNVPANFQSEYDLEWAWMDESAVADYTVGGNVDMNLVFENNATRVSTTNNNYYIPLLYEEDGRLYARVRMAQKKVNGQRVEGNWFYLSDGGLAYLPRTTGHQDSLNWQATTTFAEEGKRKTVIQYFDGSLRGRQTVTKDNVNRTTVVAESFYDYQGRPVIQVLPAPTLNTIIGFTKNFNQFDDARNAKTVYDKLDVNQSACNKLTAKMLKTADGSAAQYYSDNNPLAIAGYNKFIPDAAGYPYTETRYTNDGTGRVDAQGGVGPIFQVNSGKETKYFYESADQDDLDALFGTDAGYASHYSKNWVRDANGQYSISFVDMKGKTIATALAGDTPTNLKALASYASASKQITRQLIDPETNNAHGNSIISSKSLMVAKAGNFHFNYYLSPEKLKMMLCTNTEFCFDCLYELNISIVPDCSDKVIAGFTNPLVKKNFNLGEYLTSCAGNQSPLLDTIFDVWLEEGAYTVVKELKLSTASRDWYRENVYITNDTCKRKIDFIMQQYNLALSQQNCYVTCAQCTTKLGSLTTFIDSFKSQSGLPDSMVTVMMPQIIAAYEEAKANCDRICDNANGESFDELASIKEIMLQDMAPPVGQYARRNDDDHPNQEQNPYNIFKSPPSVVICPPSGTLRESFRYPVDYNAGAGTVTCAPGYRNEFGSVTLPGSDLLRASYNSDTLTENFEDSYAKNLLPYHPEFCKLKFAETNLKGTYRFSERVQNTETFNQAITRGFINTGITDPGAAADFFMQKDSFFLLVGAFSPYYTQMRNAIISKYVAAGNCPQSQDISMWKLAQLSVFCHKEMRSLAGQIPGPNGCLVMTQPFLDCYATLTNLPPSTVNHCEADMNMVWKNFKALYLSFRNIMVSNYLSANCSGIDYTIFNPANGYHYQERFTRYSASAPYTLQNVPDLEGLLGNHGPEYYTAQALAQADSVCRANTGNWMMRVRRCPQIETLAQTNPTKWASDSAWLSEYLVKICIPGVDYMGHPFGAASLPDGKPAIEITRNPDLNPVSVFVRNFPALIGYYLNFRNIPVDTFCYPELVDFPKAYNVAPPVVITPIITAPEPCSCERINYFKTKWQNAGSPGTFSYYLLNTQGTTISQDTLDLLVSMCATGNTSTNPNCNFLTAPIKLPAIFQCRGTANPDSSKTCITCADYKAIKIAFKAERGIDAPIDTPQTASEVALNKAFQDFANYRTGFSKLWPEYVAFGLLCPNDSGFTCATLTTLLNQYNASPHPDTGIACRNAFVTFMNNATGRNFTYEQWMDEFIKACGAQPPVCQTILTCTGLRSLIDSYYKHYGFQIWRNSNCQQLFTNFINDSLQTTYTYNDIVNKYNYLCGSSCPLNVCGFPNAHLLTLMYNTYKMLIIGSDPTSIDVCQQNFTIWFNDQLGFTFTTPYTWQQIVSLYQMYSIDCTPDLNQLCTPPYSCEKLNYILQQFYVAYPGADTMSHCQQLFADFFNLQMSTNYSFQEIAGLYATICHTTLRVCESSTSDWDCKELILLTQTPYICNKDRCMCFTQQFNDHFGTSYTYEEIVAIYKAHCNYELNMCPVEPPVFNCDQLQITLKNFYKKYPGGGTVFGADCQAFFAGFFNGENGTNLNYTAINEQYLVVCGDSLQVCNSNCVEYTSFVNSFDTRFGNMYIPLEARRQLFSYLFYEAFRITGAAAPVNVFTNAQRLMTGNKPLIYPQIKQLLTGCVTMPSSLESETQLLSITDPNVLKDYKTAYYLLHPSGVPSDCQNDFTAWVRSTMNVDYDYKGLQNLYNTYLGANAGDICGSSNNGALSAGNLSVSNLEGRFSLPPSPPMLCGLNVEILNPPPVDTSTCKDPWLLALSDANVKYELYLDSLRRNFDVAWYNKCIRAKELESFTVTYQKAEYHYTLYCYDQAGQLVRTIPPEGVDDRRADAVFLANVKAKRLNVKNGQLEQNNILVPNHTLPTDYRYNTLGQVVQQKTPDGGLSRFWYDILGRLVVSQNAQQALTDRYSYTKYDILGRIEEVGQKPQGDGMNQLTSRSVSLLNIWLNTTANKEQITRTVYDVSYFNGDDVLKPQFLYQRNLRNRVSYTQVFDNQPGSYAGTHRAATYYTYDIHGNVDTLLQDYGNNAYYSNVMNINGNRYKKMAYDYDLVSGKVNMVTYQPGYYNSSTQTWVSNTDQFYHRYVYDAENKLTDVYTSHDSLVWERDAQYIYYKHGPLARTVLGQQQVQGVDYAYTLQGWLKGVNSTAVTPAGEETCESGTAKDILDVYMRQQYGAPSIYTARQEVNFHPEFDHDPGDDFETIINASLAPCVPVITPVPYANGDMGEDGKLNIIGRLIPRDAYGFALNYYQLNGGSGLIKDYQSINPGYQPFAGGMFNLDNTDNYKTAKPLFNGNIASMFVNIPKLGNPQLYGYEYDQLNRLVGMDAFGGFDNSSNSWTNGTPTASHNYKERISYDANGNILSYLRNGSNAFGGNLAMDTLTYQYAKNPAGKILNNRLRYVHDRVNPAAYTEDIDSQTPLNLSQVLEERLPEQAGDNYAYDAIGNLIKDTKEGITNITWNVYGKIASIVKNGKTITYTYDATGNRISKTVPNDIPVATSNTTWYVRDATGNVMSVYEQRTDLNSYHLTQSEVHLYGSSRLGIINVNRDMTVPPPGEMAGFERGKKMYELSNHLGNVLAAVSDRKLSVDAGTYQMQCYPCFPDVVCPPCVYNQVSSALDGLTDYYNADVITANDYYSGGMQLSGRVFQTGANSYRYSVNGQEKSNEIASNTTTAEFWQYDTRIVRRWNMDPKPNTSISSYNCFGGNPILNIDILGDTLDVGGNLKASKDDINSLARAANQKYIVFDKNNRVALNFTGLTPAQQATILNNDKGLQLIKDVIDSDKKMLYEATDLGFYTNSTGTRQVGILRQNDVNSVKNTSNFGADSQGGFDEKPRSGYDGHLMIDTKTTWDEEDASGTPVSKPRNTMVFHELAENYYRTHFSVNYKGNRSGAGMHKIGAHQLAINLEKTWHAASNSPGGVSAINATAVPASETAAANRYNHIYQTTGLTREDFLKVIAIMQAIK